MSVYADILAWSSGLPDWQRDTLRRLATLSILGNADIQELTLACLDEANQRPVASMVPIDASHVPSFAAGSPMVGLTAIAACRCLNRIADGQSLSFGASGLTIVYGDNATGKSGFARVLRGACHARGAGGEVLPDVYAASRGYPQAFVKYAVDGAPGSFDWSQGGAAAPNELRAVSIFDSIADAAFVEGENEIVWAPGGLDLLVRLAPVVDKVREQLGQQDQAIALPGSLPQLPPGTRAATFISQLSATTSLAALDAFALAPAEETELSRIDALLASDPALKVAAIQQRAQRLRGLRDRVARLEEYLGQTGLQTLAALHSSWEAAVTAETALAQSTFGDSLVPGVGGDTWRVLWDAAESYARSGATADGKFPSDGPNGRCVLCQQPLATDACGRLERFYAFVRSDLAKKRSTAGELIRKRIDEVHLLRAQESADAAVLEELAAIDGNASNNLGAFLAAASGALSVVAAMSAEWRLPDPLPVGWATWLDGIIAETDKQATAMQSAADPAQQAALRAQRSELSARQVLTANRASVVAEIHRLVRRAELKRAISACNTLSISRKAGELTRSHVTDALTKAFLLEADTLRVPATVAYAHSRTGKATSYQRIILSAAGWAGTAGGPTRVLSEGERRSVALAAFLAEVEFRGDHSAVVFDDPVSSLDHERRRLVAARLAELARARQVIVFTHDLVFLHMLKQTADEKGIAVTDREIGRNSREIGICREHAPTQAMRINSLVGELKNRQQACAAAERAGKGDECEGQLTVSYDLLRKGWERAVEELLFNQAVMRFDQRIQTNRLKPVHDIRPEDIAQIDAGMTECSKQLHALAPAMNEPRPTPADLLSGVQRLEQFVRDMRGRGRQ